MEQVSRILSKVAKPHKDILHSFWSPAYLNCGFNSLQISSYTSYQPPSTNGNKNCINIWQILKNLHSAMNK